MKRPTKADIGRLQRLAREWQKEEETWQNQYGDALPRTERATRIKDREALLRLIDFAQSL